MQNFINFCQRYNLVNLKIKYKWKDAEESIALKYILPEKFCILAFHAVYPYMLTLSCEGWFNWVNYGEGVIVNCPSPEGVVMSVKPLENSHPAGMEVKITRNNRNCCMGYADSDSFIFSFDKEKGLLYKMLYNIISFSDIFLTEDSIVKEFNCFYKDDLVKYRVEPE
ncbi:MAG: hypothetical protein Q7O04_00820 [Candidatus Omnitrophota bacterium]|nr:hypothetical protein [Candidatus Omnitrophota bacterium]